MSVESHFGNNIEVLTSFTSQYSYKYCVQVRVDASCIISPVSSSRDSIVFNEANIHQLQVHVEVACNCCGSNDIVVPFSDEACDNAA